MTAPIDRTLAVLELLSLHPEGLTLLAVATRLDLPPSATHRLLNDLLRLGYVCQPVPQGPYALTLRLAALGLSWLGRTGLTDMAQPVLDRLAAACGELVRLSVADGDSLVWVAVAQGATSGLRYDPAREQGSAASLAYSASGRAWAASLPQDRALSLIAAQGLTPPEGAAQGSQLDLAGMIEVLAQTRAAGHGEAVDCFLDGMAAIAVALPAEGPSPGCLSIAGPAVRLTAARRAELLPALHAAAEEIMAIAPASQLLRGAP
ncbi:helix-turn-helix domain-containing protein [Frigidibacter albus]|uniref:Helix-turn-helix domain-containing protein n=1 Tax=Frigidibacter albus TaxID=1465486 RepID=A0A6L8VKI5_9RHOB|nr:IclR family transcriptional regulator [Frigidibacter albus]MZQ90544.1 helix-turn-helix domain-containing protein [Frigidibacter albus]NBE32336.1 helix-turn-helix domain-containing protein [Frigidibacter albus]GGH59236.1 transcriptional regulator [Frigidibacter albus]